MKQHFITCIFVFFFTLKNISSPVWSLTRSVMVSVAVSSLAASDIFLYERQQRDSTAQNFLRRTCMVLLHEPTGIAISLSKPLFSKERGVKRPRPTGRWNENVFQKCNHTFGFPLFLHSRYRGMIFDGVQHLPTFFFM